MKVLLVHNFYQSSAPSGEDIVFKNEVELLKKNGINVITYERHNDEIGTVKDRIKSIFTNIWSQKTYREIKQLLKNEKPDIVHFHNIWYLISPSAYYACHDEGVPVVQTLHNFRIFCANGLLMRDGKVCEECVVKKIGHRSIVGNKLKIIQNAIKYGCYRNSRIYSLPIAFMEYIHWMKKTWIHEVDGYIALTEFSKRKYIKAGLPEYKIFVKPNFSPAPPTPKYSSSDYAVFLGRLSVEKGVDVLIKSIQYLSYTISNLSSVTHSRFQIKIIGDGPLMDSLQHFVRIENIKNIEFTGRKIFDDAMVLLNCAKFLIMPSICYEGFPMIIIEAFACGKPVIASRLGSMAELIEEGKTGLLFEPGNVADLAENIKWMIEHENECIEMGRNARKVFEEKYTAKRNYEMLMNIYNNVINNTKKLKK